MQIIEQVSCTDLMHFFSIGQRNLLSGQETIAKKEKRGINKLTNRCRIGVPPATYCNCAHPPSLDSRYVHHSAIAWECKWHYCSGIVPHCRRENHNSARPKCPHWYSPKSDRTVSIRRCTSCRWRSETRSTDRLFRLPDERRATVSHSMPFRFLP